MLEIFYPNKNKPIIIDEEDYVIWRSLTWSFSTKEGSSSCRYAHHNPNHHKGGHAWFYLHKAILELPSSVRVDHINRNPLDNRKCNLRVCSARQNTYNQGKRNGNYTSKYKGVYWHKRDKRWRSVIMIKGKSLYLGSFENEIDAAGVYDEAARIYHGKFAVLNFPNL